jgi:peptidoglycan/xylan/chitin deacetylase (PgdA/CDA1 family)
MYAKNCLTSSLPLLLLAGNVAYADGNRHVDPLRAISSRGQQQDARTASKPRKKTSGRHYSPLEALNGRIVVKNRPGTSKNKETTTQKQNVNTTSTKHVIQLDVKPIVKRSPGTHHPITVKKKQAQVEEMEVSNSLSALDILDGRAKKTKPIRPEKSDVQTVDGMILPPETNTFEKEVEIVVTDPDSEMLTEDQLKALKEAPVTAPTSPAQANNNGKAYHTAIGKTLYMTFDDGPISGTANLLRILKEENVEATMFFIGREVVRNPKQFQRAMSMPNVLVANHTYTHANNHYRRFYNGTVSSVVADIDKAQVAIGGAKYLRLCGRNVWRLPTVKRNDWGISVAQRGREINKYDALRTSGYYIYGWDAEWAFSHKTQKPLFSGEEMARRVNLKYAGAHTIKPGKVILLAHDFMFRTAYNAQQLRTFIRIMKAQGWSFKTIDDYSATTPDVYVKKEKKTDPDKLKPAQKIAQKATVMVPVNKPEVTQEGSVKKIDIATQLSKALRQQSFLQVRRLLAKGAEINGKDLKGEIPLNIAIETNNAVLVRMMVERGARIFNLDAKGMSPMGVAHQHNNTIIIRYLNRQITKQKVRRLRQTVFASNESITHE